MVQASLVQLSILVAMHRLGPRESEKAGWMQIRMNHQGQEWFQSSETGCSVAQKWLETHGLDQIYQHLNLRSISCSFGGKAGQFSATSTTHLLNRSLWSTWLFGCLQWKTFRWDEVGLNDITKAPQQSRWRIPSFKDPGFQVAFELQISLRAVGKIKPWEVGQRTRSNIERWPGCFLRITLALTMMFPLKLGD